MEGVGAPPNLKGKLPELKLGSQQPYAEVYDASLLQPIPRGLSRQALVFTGFEGVDIWTAYELSWLNKEGKPVVAIAEFVVPANSKNIIESKSLKYYLNSLNQTVFSDFDSVQTVLERDLSLVAAASVVVKLYSLESFSKHQTLSQSMGVCLDGLPVTVSAYQPSKSLLQVSASRAKNTWCSHLLKSNCPVTGQPDWASVWIGVNGLSLTPESLLQYIIAYRQHQDFHENCVESMFNDLLAVCEPEELWVYARYTRRGGLDINPFRSLTKMAMPNVVGVRQ